MPSNAGSLTNRNSLKALLDHHLLSVASSYHPPSAALSGQHPAVQRGEHQPGQIGVGAQEDLLCLCVPIQGALFVLRAPL